MGPDYLCCRLGRFGGELGQGIAPELRRLGARHSVLLKQDEERHALDAHAAAPLLQLASRRRDCPCCQGLPTPSRRARIRPRAASAPRARRYRALPRNTRGTAVRPPRPGGPGARPPRSGGARGAYWACAASGRRRRRSRAPGRFRHVAIELGAAGRRRTCGRGSSARAMPSAGMSGLSSKGRQVKLDWPGMPAPPSAASSRRLPT